MAAFTDETRKGKDDVVFQDFQGYSGYPNAIIYPATTLQQDPPLPSGEIHCCELWH